MTRDRNEGDLRRWMRCAIGLSELVSCIAIEVTRERESVKRRNPQVYKYYSIRKLEVEPIETRRIE